LNHSIKCYPKNVLEFGFMIVRTFAIYSEHGVSFKCFE
jgi:hypothetical protein